MKLNTTISIVLGLMMIATFLMFPSVNAEEDMALDQDFEEDSGWGDQFGTPPYAPPLDWTTNNSEGYFWQDGSLIDQGYPHTGSRYAYSYSNMDSMISPTVTLGTVETGHVLTFWYAAENSMYPQNLEVYVNGNLEWSDSDFTHEAEDSKPDNGYEQASVHLNEYAGNDIILEFINTGTTGLYGQMIDDIVVTTIREDSSSNDDSPSNDEDDGTDSPNPGPGPGASPDSNQAPVADFSVSASITTVNTEIIFNASDSVDGDGDELEYRWDFDDSHQDMGLTVNHSYDTVGIYAVTLTVQDENGGSDTVSKEIVVNPVGNNPPKIPSVRTSAENLDVNTSYYFQIASIDLDGDQVKFMINWGDGTVNDTTGVLDDENDSTFYFANISHLWEKAGVYIISVRAIDDQNASSELKQIPVFVNVDVISIDDGRIGYLVDFYRNNTITHFYNTETISYSEVERVVDQSSDENDPSLTYLIDVTGDSIYDYEYSEAKGLLPYSSTDGDDNGSRNGEDDASEDTPGFEFLLFLGAILLFLGVLKRKI
jgi:PKD repeat protein